MPDFSYRTWLKTWRKADSPVFPEARWLVVTFWTDAATAETLDEARTVAACTAGFLVHADSRELKIAQSIYGDQEAKEVTTIPASTITYILEILELPT